MTNDELLDIGIQKRNDKKNKESWEELNIKYDSPFKNGEAWRNFTRKTLAKQKSNTEIVQDTTQNIDEDKYNETLEILPDGRQISDKLIKMSEENSKDIEFLMKAHGYDIKDWEMVSARNNFWNVYSKAHGIQVLYSSKITVKPRVNNISLEEIKEHFEKFSKEYRKVNYPIKEYKLSNKMLEVPIMDLHLGKLGWGLEVGENYDYKIAEERFLRVVNDFINRTSNYDFEKIIFPIGQDFFNFDNIEGTTTKGTRQDNDLRWQKLYLKGLEILIASIDILSEKAPVEIFYVPGNHDKMTSYYAINYIYAWYKNNHNVSVSIDPKTRKYIEFGNCLIGYAHGDSEKKKITGIMQVEAKEAWGRTKYHEWHLGHLHSEHSNEVNGIIIRNIGSITGSDAWHIESGYVGAIRKATAFIWDKDYGLDSILNSVIV